MKLEKTVLLTGATGFVGKAVASKVKTKELRLLGRRDPRFADAIFCKAEISPVSDYATYLEKVDVVIHAAARVHVMADTAADPLDEYRAVNTAGTLNLAKQAAAAGVKRFIFVSSVKVNGEATSENQTFRYDDTTQPEDPYGISKAEAESGLKQIAAETGMEVVIIRSPLVYGPGVKANFSAIGSFQPSCPKYCD